MTSTFTPNIDLEKPARGDDVGTWDMPVNANSDLLDKCIGAIATISLNNSPVVLSAAQFQSENITFGSTLTGSVAITFPTSFTKPYTIGNFCTGSSAFTITLQTTASGGQVICCPPGEYVDVLNDGTNLKFKNLGRVGSYVDFAGSSVPNWVSGSSPAPYLACVGGSVSSATHPILFGMIGATLPDTRGRAGIAIDAGAGRVSSAVSGVAGNTLFGSGGDQNIPVHSHGVIDPGHIHTEQAHNGGGGAASGVKLETAVDLGTALTNTITASAATGISINSAGTGTAANMPPSFVYGIKMIRAA